MLGRVLWVPVFALFFYGTWTGLHKGGEDFRVFRHAAELVLQGKGSLIYADSPDRYLYAPGTAWLLTPFAKLSWQDSFILWSVLKFFALFGTLRILARRYGEVAAHLAVLILARPFLIELRYGQVNLLILFASLFALDLWCRRERVSPVTAASGWFLAGIAAGTKLFPGAVLLAPFFALFRPMRRTAVIASLGAFAAGVVLIFVPSVTEGMNSILPLHLGWAEALRAKGFPTETHNQSFTAFLLHTLSGQKFFSLTLGAQQTGTAFGPAVLSTETIFKIGAALSAAIIAGLFALAFRISRNRDFFLVPFLIAGLILPSHLIWKPYFILGIPLVAQLWAIAPWSRYSRLVQGLTIVLALGLNFASLDLIGARGAATFEAYAGFLWVYLALAGLVFWVKPAVKN